MSLTRRQMIHGYQVAFAPPHPQSLRIHDDQVSTPLTPRRPNPLSKRQQHNVPRKQELPGVLAAAFVCRIR